MRPRRVGSGFRLGLFVLLLDLGVADDRDVVRVLGKQLSTKVESFIVTC